MGKFPEEIALLTRLARLDLSGNALYSLPETIGNLALLNCLKIANNKLSALPSSFSKLKMLKELNLTRNQFSHLPKAICFLSNLESLYFTKNPLTTIPPEFCQLPKLHTFLCSSSPTSKSPISDVSYPIYRFHLRTLEPFFDLGKIKIPDSEEIIGLSAICQEDLTIFMPEASSVIGKMTTFSRFILVHKGSAEVRALYIPIIEGENFLKTVGKRVHTTAKNAIHEVKKHSCSERPRVYTDFLWRLSRGQSLKRQGKSAIFN